MGEKTEQITLVLFGSESLRVRIFPTIGRPNPVSQSYKESFNNNTAKGLVIYGGAWFYKDNAIHSSPNENGRTGEGTKIIATATRFSDFIYKADISVNSAGNAVFRVMDPAVGSEAYKGYYLGFNPETGIVELGKSSNKRWIVITSAKYQVKMKETFKVKVKTAGDKFEVFINGNQPIITTTDSEFKTGTIGLRSWNALATVDNIDIVKL